jgi:hypothetical protein
MVESNAVGSNDRCPLNGGEMYRKLRMLELMAFEMHLIRQRVRVQADLDEGIPEAQGRKAQSGR